jgi:malate dehydrogenase (oxaloacetate-decarboxylating)(NADP+)
MKNRKEDALKADALEYHRREPKGKIEVSSTKPVSTQRDLSLAYSPGVAYPCLEIAADKDKVYEYTAKDNLVAVLTNGTAVLGLGNIGPEAAKPVMEGKAVLFKKFAGIDVFDIEINANTVEEFIAVAKALEPTFGGINMEDVKAPESFEIEQRLVAEMNIPVMHDDQHGTAIISSAALINALKVVDKQMHEVKFVVIGAGAAALACLNLYQELGAKAEHMQVFDREGHIYKGRPAVNPYQIKYAHSARLTLLEAFEGADVMIGLASGGVVSQEMVKRMAANPIVFALANPDPEITAEAVLEVRPDAVMATGRSDYPNQVNNALGFPYIFRGALDVRATTINSAMKIASAIAIAELAHETVPESVNEAYDEKNLIFGRNYLIPKPLDPRLITSVSSAVARAAMESGVARKPIEDFEAYKVQLEQRVGRDESLSKSIIARAQKNPKRVVFAEADTYKILKAAQILKDEGIAIPILLGNQRKINAIIAENNLDLAGIQIIDPWQEEEHREVFGQLFYEKRKRKGMTLHDAIKLMRDRNYYGAMMVETGVADAFVSGLTKNYPSSIKPALQAIGRRDEGGILAGMHIVKTKNGPFFFADTTINKKPNAQELVGIAKLVESAVRFFHHTPRIAMLSYSNFGSNIDDDTSIVIEATSILRKEFPNWILDGDIQANVAMRPDILEENYSFSVLAKTGGANTFIFPNLMAGNIAYKLMDTLGDFELIGPILLGMRKPVHILQLGSSVTEIVNIAAIAVVDAQTKEVRK